MKTKIFRLVQFSAFILIVAFPDVLGFGVVFFNALAQIAGIVGLVYSEYLWEQKGGKVW